MQLTEKQKSEGWRIVKFGEIAKSVSKRVDPSETELEIYVGLEHLDPDNLRITRRGVPSDVKGQKLLVKPGQIIFGKRRAYQRKVAVADFEGICSAHAMVLEAIPEAVVPEYLPFFMQSDMFMERAVAISEGSLSPTIKWKTLANQEFPLPSRPRQEEMLRSLKLIDTALKNCDEILKVAGLLKTVLISDKQSSHYINGQLSDLIRIKSGFAFKSKQFVKDGMPILRISNIGENRSVDLSDAVYYQPQSNLDRYLVSKGDVMIAMSGATTGKSGRLEKGNAYLNQRVGMVEVKNGASLSYVYHLLGTQSVLRELLVDAVGGAQPNISPRNIERSSATYAPIDEQEQIANNLDEIQDIERTTQAKIQGLVGLKSKYIQESNNIEEAT